MKELIEKKIFEIVTACRQARIEIGLHDLEPEGRNKVIDEMLHRAIIKANELEAALKPRTIESAPKNGAWFLAWKGLWVIVAWDNSLEEFIDDDYEAQRSLTHWLPLPSDGGEE